MHRRHFINGDGKFAQATALTGRMYIIDCAYQGFGIRDAVPAGDSAAGTMSKKVVNLRFCRHRCVQEGQPDWLARLVNSHWQLATPIQ